MSPLSLRCWRPGPFLPPDLLFCERLCMIDLRLNVSEMNRLHRNSESTHLPAGWSIRFELKVASCTTFLFPVPRIRKVIMSEPSWQLSSHPALSLISSQGLRHTHFPLVCCHYFIQPLSFPLFSTYLTGESHKEVKFLSLWEEEMRERFAFITKRYLLPDFSSAVFSFKNVQWICRC